MPKRHSLESILQSNKSHLIHPPESKNLKETDLSRDTIPRAIYNDHIEELLLRVEGYSGRKIKNEGLVAPLQPMYMDVTTGKPLHYRMQKLAQQEACSKEVTIDSNENLAIDPEENRTVILTEWGIDIMNLSIADPIEPIVKPNFRSPMERPIHNLAKHKALPPSFPRTIRYATWRNVLGVHSSDAVKKAHDTCKEMDKKAKDCQSKHQLKYKRKIQKIKCNYLAPGLSFRGRGMLEKQWNWPISLELQEYLNIQQEEQQLPSKQTDLKESVQRYMPLNASQVQVQVQVVSSVEPSPTDSVSTTWSDVMQNISNLKPHKINVEIEKKEYLDHQVPLESSKDSLSSKSSKVSSKADSEKLSIFSSPKDSGESLILVKKIDQILSRNDKLGSVETHVHMNDVKSPKNDFDLIESDLFASILKEAKIDTNAFIVSKKSNELSIHESEGSNESLTKSNLASEDSNKETPIQVDMSKEEEFVKSPLELLRESQKNMIELPEKLPQVDQVEEEEEASYFSKQTPTSKSASEIALFSGSNVISSSFILESPFSNEPDYINLSASAKAPGANRYLNAIDQHILSPTPIEIVPEESRPFVSDSYPDDFNDQSLNESIDKKSLIQQGEIQDELQDEIQDEKIHDEIQGEIQEFKNQDKEDDDLLLMIFNKSVSKIIEPEKVAVNLSKPVKRVSFSENSSPNVIVNQIESILQFPINSTSEPDTKVPQEQLPILTPEPTTKVNNDQVNKNETKPTWAAPPALTLSPVDILSSPIKVTFEGEKCELKLLDFELICSNKKQVLEDFPLEIRRIVSIEPVFSSNELILQVCIRKKSGKGKFKKCIFMFQDKSLEIWSKSLEQLVYSGSGMTSKKIILLIDKSDAKETSKLVEKYMEPVFNAAKRNVKTKVLQFNEFSVSNALTDLNFGEISNILCIHKDYGHKLMQILVRNQYYESPEFLVTEQDPVEVALCLVKSTLLKPKQLYISSVLLEREKPPVMTSLFKAFK